MLVGMPDKKMRRRHAMMVAHAAVLCLLLCSGCLAAAEKTFGRGGAGFYGGEGEGEGEAGGQQKAAEEATTGGSGGEGGSYSTPSESSTPSAPAAASEGTDGGSSSSSSSSSTPSESAEAAPSTPAASGLDPDGEPEYGLNAKAIEDIVREHNVFRAREHVPPLAWNATLAKFSQQYAETLKKECKSVHSTSPYGENLMLGVGAITWKKTVDEWSDEKKSYHYASNTCDAGKMCGHYTAVVWKGTTTVGCGRVKCDNGDTMIMCSYWPPGNYDGVKPF